MHKAIGSNILSEIEETFLLKILNAFHSRQRFSCVKNFLWLSTKLRQSYPLPPTWFLLQVPFSNCSTRSHCTNVQISCNETLVKHVFTETIDFHQNKRSTGFSQKKYKGFSCKCSAKYACYGTNTESLNVVL